MMNAALRQSLIAEQQRLDDEIAELDRDRLRSTTDERVYRRFRRRTQIACLLGRPLCPISFLGTGR